MRVTTLHRFLLLFLLAALATSCTTAKKRKNVAEVGNPLRAVAVEDPLTDEQIEELKAIAADPNSSLSFEEMTADEPGETEDATSGDPAIAWKRPGLNPVSVNPGDVFSDNVGPILKKEFSLADTLPEEQRRAFFQRYTSAGNMRVPMTISRDELAAFEAQAEANAIELPTRSVAVDFRTTTYSTDTARLESLYQDLQAGRLSEDLRPFSISPKAGKDLEAIKERLRNGEKLFVVTGVTESRELHASYPGAPVGRRDAEKIRNAVQQMFPHLDSLDAQKQDSSVILRGNPRVLWEFEARELKLDADRLVIDSQSLVQL